MSVIEQSIFDRFSKVEFSDGDLGKIHYKNGKTYDFSTKGQLFVDRENDLIHYNNKLSNELYKFINELEANDWKIEKRKCEKNYNESICRILKDSDFIIEDKDYYSANEKLKEALKKISRTKHKGHCSEAYLRRCPLCLARKYYLSSSSSFSLQCYII